MERRRRGWHHLTQHSTWIGLGRAQKVGTITLHLCFHPTHERVCVSERERGLTQCRPSTVTFECTHCPLVGNTQVTCPWRKKDDLMIDQLLTFPLRPCLCPLLGSTPGPCYLALSLSPFNKINITHMAAHCPSAINRPTWPHLFFNESGLCFHSRQDQVVYDEGRY